MRITCDQAVQTFALIFMCDSPLESLINGLMEGKFISCAGAISTWQARSTVITVPLVALRLIFDA